MREVKKIYNVTCDLVSLKDRTGFFVATDQIKGNLLDWCESLKEIIESMGKTTSKENQFTVFALNQIDLDLFGQLINLIKKERGGGQLGQEAVNLYQQCKQMLEPIAAVLLCYRPDGTPTTVEEFKLLLRGVHEHPEDMEKKKPAILRFLGQAFFGHDSEVGLEAVNMLGGINISAINLADVGEKLQLTVLVYLAFSVLPDLVKGQRDNLVGSCGWLAIYFNFPLAEWLKLYLADQPSTTDYVNSSGELAQSLLYSGSRLLFTEGPAQQTVGQFLQKFYVAAGEEDVKIERQQAFIASEVENNKWPSGASGKLLELLVLYIQLRECELVDYHGLLSDEGALSKPFDWKKIIQNDLDDDLLEEIKQYWRELHRPFRIKMELVTALRVLTWSEEPYLSRVLMLNDLYEEVYGHTFAPIVYFDEKTANWQIDTELKLDVLKKIENSIKTFK